jgi:hypothetical protein
VALPFTLKRMLRQKKNLQKLKHFTMQEYNLPKKTPLHRQNQKSFKILL